MTSIKRIIKESRTIHIILVIVFLTSIISRTTASAFSNMTTFGSSLFQGILLALCISMGVIGINLSNNYRLSLLFNRSRKETSKDLFIYILIISLSGSILLNTLALFIHLMPENPLVPIILGFNFNIMNGLFIRIPLLALILSGAAFIGLWLSTTFSLHGITIGLSCIIFTIALTLSLLKRIIDAWLWGQNLFFLSSLLLGVVIISCIMTYSMLLKQEVR